jgi:predicted AAA+ superfamily ATPase
MDFYFTGMLPRLLLPELRRRLTRYPAVALVGPRQCGKTTLALALGGAYYDLEQQADRLRLDLEWAERTAGSARIILDEAQAWPEIFARVRGAIDQDRKRNGRFLLLGSVSPALAAQASESLTGRLSTLELTPLRWRELPRARRAQHWLCGGFPDGGILEPVAYPEWQQDYLAQVVQRDLPTWGLPARPQVTDRLLRMLAAVHGQLWNASRIAQSLGLSYHTVNTYVEYLVGAFLIRRLPPFEANLGKRLVRSPKLYVRDSGLLHALLNVPDSSVLLQQPWVGASWEGYVVEQILGELSARGVRVTPYFFRTSDGQEIDLVLDTGTERWAIEVKLTGSPSPADMEKLDRSADLIGATRRYLVSQTPRSAGTATRASCNLSGVIDRLTS